MTNLLLTALIHRPIFVRLQRDEPGSHYRLPAIQDGWLKLEKRPAENGNPAVYRYVPFSAVAYIDADEVP